MFTSYEKLSKKQKKEFDNVKRVTWDFKPVTRVKPSAKVYNRQRLKRGAYDG